MYRLPTHPSYISVDPLSVVDGAEDIEVTQKDVLDSLLRAARESIHQEDRYFPVNKAYKILTSTIRDIVYCLHWNGSLDTSQLESVLQKTAEEYTWVADSDSIVCVLNSALRLPTLIPAAELPRLSYHGDVVRFNGEVVNCLLAHQALGTLYQPEGNTWGISCFTSWYPASDASHPNAVKGYIRTLFGHFMHPCHLSEEFSYAIHDPADMPDPGTCTTIPDFRLDIASQSVIIFTIFIIYQEQRSNPIRSCISKLTTRTRSNSNPRRASHGRISGSSLSISHHAHNSRLGLGISSLMHCHWMRWRYRTMNRSSISSHRISAKKLENCMPPYLVRLLTMTISSLHASLKLVPGDADLSAAIW